MKQDCCRVWACFLIAQWCMLVCLISEATCHGCKRRTCYCSRRGPRTPARPGYLTSSKLARRGVHMYLWCCSRGNLMYLRQCLAFLCACCVDSLCLASLLASLLPSASAGRSVPFEEASSAHTHTKMHRCRELHKQKIRRRIHRLAQRVARASRCSHDCLHCIRWWVRATAIFFCMITYCAMHVAIVQTALLVLSLTVLRLRLLAIYERFSLAA